MYLANILNAYEVKKRHFWSWYGKLELIFYFESATCDEIVFVWHLNGLKSLLKYLHIDNNG